MLRTFGTARRPALVFPLFLLLAASGCMRPFARPSAGPSASGGGPGGGGGEDDDGPAPYSEVVTEEAVTDSGMVHVHRVDDQILFEIPNDLLDREILLVTRTASVPDGMGYGGQKLNTQVVRWERNGSNDERIFLRVVTHANVAEEELPVARAVRSANFEAILRAFDIEALNDDSTSVVIDATPLFESDIPMLGLRQSFRDQYRIRSLDSDRTYVYWVKSFPRNVEVRHVLTYTAQTPPTNATTNAISVEMNQSMILLPDEPMQPRLYDERVGFFNVSQVDYGRSDQKVVTRTYVTRWRLEPSDPAAFRRGELVDPVKPIVYYLDPATPEKWRPYLIQGIEDWQEAFEAAGFSNAIQGRMPPSFEEDPEFSPEDVRYSVIRWLPSQVQNASGPHVHDPRTGEILESDIQWYHNVANLLRNWYLIQTGAVNPAARRALFDDEVMGELIRFVAAHEVGHTIGLQHNMKSSSAFPVDSLRAPGFVCRNGVAPSIMDYARFNYVAQPEDDGACTDPRIGEYDRFAINWGYRPILDADADEERPTLDAWIREVEDDPVYYFGSSTPIDPSAQTEAIGSDATEASDLGIENLKRILPNLIEWSSDGREGENYSELAELYSNVIGQWSRYMGHVGTVVGGVTRTRKRIGQEGPVYEFVDEATQRRAMDFFARQAFEPPTWMIDEEILSKIENPSTVDRMRGIQVRVVNLILDPGRMQRLIEAEARNGDDHYSLGEMFEELRDAIWGELETGAPIGVYRRNLQRGHLERLEFLMTSELVLPAFVFAALSDFFTSVDVSQSDIRAFVRGELTGLQEAIEGALRRDLDRTTELHLRDALARIDEILDP
ncbi:zinc-dependent metalloprotease [Candidatus Palauibacter sp.]|uniref:zinc-dependent metalloprotease n=1 Tax=Candidatus Palauibacter sp. TaxID=3101350 RepID=UPI003CC5E6E8